MGQDVEWAKSVISQKLRCKMKDLVRFSIKFLDKNLRKIDFLL